ncbi:MAG: ABC transporter substrate-binding protein, partial [Thermoleophilia bacterium]|nr:ABC transporter substrate-binding protein [Thermoleophilia bacterium]
MLDVSRNDQTQHGDTTSPARRPVSRREFLKLAGLLGASAVAAGGLGGLLAACGDDEEATATTAAPVTTAGPTTTAGADMGREVKIGFVTPITGGIAAMGMADQFCVDQWVKAIGDGLVCGDGKKHPIKFEVLDSQSDSMRASQVAGDLIQNVKVDIIMAAATPDTVNPVADTAESMGTPCITCDTPTESYYFGRGATPEKPFKWTYHAFWGMQQIQNVSLSLWDQIATNKVVGALWPNNVDGNAYRDSYPPFMDKNGYTLVDGGMYQEPNEDWTAMISEFKKAGAEIFT